MKTNRPSLVPPRESVNRSGASVESDDLLFLPMLEALSHLGIGAVAFDSNDECRYCSRFVSNLLAVTPRNKNDFIRNISVDEKIRARLWEMMGTGLFKNQSLSVSYGGHQLLQIDTALVEAADTSFDVVFVRDVSADIEQRKQMARLNRLASMGQVAAGAAHEFNNNLTSVLGWAQIAMRNTDADSPAFSALEIIEDNARKAKRIFTRLLDLSRSNAGSQTTVSLTKIVEDVLTLLHFEMKQAGIAVVRRFDDDAGQCTVDEDAISQVLVNIIRNAIDAISGGGTLTIGIHSDEQRINLTLTDDGPGMSSEVLEHIFDTFFSTKQQDDDTHGGTGLGLSISRDIIREHGGDITARSTPGDGTCFTISLPAAAARAVKKKRRSRPTIPPGAVVLVVDDEPDIGEMIRTSLELQGVSVLSVSSGDDAVTEVKRLRFDAAFVDYSMPGLSGHDLGEKLLSIQPNMPIIFMSGLTVKKNSVAEDFLKKPFDLDEIRTILYRVLKRRKERDSDPA